jgi:hypothetical protein
MIQYERVDVNYARLSYKHELFHVVAHGKRLKPRATALCGLKREQSWEDCRVRRPEQVCGLCQRKLDEIEASQNG